MNEGTKKGVEKANEKFYSKSKETKSGGGTTNDTTDIGTNSQDDWIDNL